MYNNILTLLLFSLITVILFNIVPNTWKRYVLLIASLSYYLLYDAKFLILLLVNILWSYFIGNKIISSKFKADFMLFISIVPIIISLCFFKYYHFFIPKGSPIIWSVVLPLGISYYTFKIISYLADIASRKRTPEESIVNYIIYISFFPQITCGPISRSLDITSQLSSLHQATQTDFKDGIKLICSGLFKKIVIADRLSTYVNTIFSSSDSYPGLALWMAAFFFTIQLYCDFAGYSEISIGICRLLGISCQPNFQAPYLSYSIHDFWRRWHISLSSWLRDYVYIPLGGNRGAKRKKNLRILTTFLVSGIWHGSGLQFLVWGLWHGILSLLPVKKTTHKIGACIQIALTFISVMFGWILFRSSSLLAGFHFMKMMFTKLSLDTNSIIASVIPFTGDYSCLAYLLTVCLFILVLFIFELKDCKHKTIFYIFSIILFGVIGQSSFLYANF